MCAVYVYGTVLLVRCASYENGFGTPLQVDSTPSDTDRITMGPLPPYRSPYDPCPTHNMRIPPLRSPAPAPLLTLNPLPTQSPLTSLSQIAPLRSPAAAPMLMVNPSLSLSPSTPAQQIPPLPSMSQSLPSVV